MHLEPTTALTDFESKDRECLARTPPKVKSCWVRSGLLAEAFQRAFICLRSNNKELFQSSLKPISAMEILAMPIKNSSVIFIAPILHQVLNCRGSGLALFDLFIDPSGLTGSRLQRQPLFPICGSARVPWILKWPSL